MKNFYKILIVGLVLVQGCAKTPVSFKDSSIGKLDNWSEQNFELAYSSFVENCNTIRHKKGTYLHNNKVFGSLNDWKDICREIKSISHNDFKSFIEKHFNLLEVLSQKPSLFTGYYTPTLKGSLVKTSQFSVPLYEKPNDIYTADLGQFYPELKGKKIIARVDEKKNLIKPYYTRQEIDALYAKLKPFIWLESPIDQFFLHIQGSGYVELPNKQVVHVAYAGSNGHDYKAIGRTLIENGWMKKEDVTMQSISAWLKDNPKKQQEVFNTNPRYIFFRKGLGKTTGSLGVPLKEEQSIAVDPHYIPLGIPGFVDTKLTYNNRPFKRMIYTQDTGAAIKGGVRGDIFFGKGEKAELLSGAQNASGSLYVFVPKSIYE
tara:strand:+ start:115550 stop:116671 length:1122 start_codon:yes stop_codon:yes gene_type:complete